MNVKITSKKIENILGETFMLDTEVEERIQDALNNMDLSGIKGDTGEVDYSNVYTKTEINDMIGDIETLLNNI